MEEDLNFQEMEEQIIEGMEDDLKFSGNKK
jgi:hypothetical protein